MDSINKFFITQVLEESFLPPKNGDKKSNYQSDLTWNNIFILFIYLFLLFLKISFKRLLQNLSDFFFFKGLSRSAFPLTKAEGTHLRVCVVKNMVCSKRSKLDFRLVCCTEYSASLAHAHSISASRGLHHTRRKKSNFFPLLHMHMCHMHIYLLHICQMKIKYIVFIYLMILL